MINEKPFFGLAYYSLSKETIRTLEKAVQFKDSLSTLEYLGLSYRIISALECNGVMQINDLLNATRDEIAGIPNVGEKAVFDILQCLKRYSEIPELRRVNENSEIFKLKRKN
jgi:DNA-directed RNA polymerase alpha subunit